ncbi:MAG: shikimate dehydrogenase, partial [Mycobacterium sp.]
MLGSPIAHSRSPQLHLAAYRALGLADWTYQRIECDADELPGVVVGFGPEWVGVSVTMPGKFAALRFADQRTERAELVGAANTLLRTPDGWRADNTDVDGVSGALGSEGLATGTAVVSGSGGTAPA